MRCDTIGRNGVEGSGGLSTIDLGYLQQHMSRQRAETTLNKTNGLSQMATALLVSLDLHSVPRGNLPVASEISRQA